MEKFKVIKLPKPQSKSQFCFQMDDDLQLWIRLTAYENDVSISDVMHQALCFAKKNEAVRQPGTIRGKK